MSVSLFLIRSTRAGLVSLLLQQWVQHTAYRTTPTGHMSSRSTCQHLSLRLHLRPPHCRTVQSGHRPAGAGWSTTAVKTNWGRSSCSKSTGGTGMGGTLGSCQGQIRLWFPLPLSWLGQQLLCNSQPGCHGHGSTWLERGAHVPHIPAIFSLWTLKSPTVSGGRWSQIGKCHWTNFWLPFEAVQETQKRSGRGSERDAASFRIPWWQGCASLWFEICWRATQEETFRNGVSFFPRRQQAPCLSAWLEDMSETRTSVAAF